MEDALLALEAALTPEGVEEKHQTKVIYSYGEDEAE